MNTVATHKCPNCDGPLLFDPKEQVFQCEYCGSKFTEQDLTSIIEATVDALPTEEDTQEPTFDRSSSDESASENATDASILELFTCPNCGAEVVTDQTTSATHCYYCHNPVVLTGRVSGEFLPQSILPFAIDREEVVKQFLTWGKKKKFVPKDFFTQSQVEKITGVYFPYWVVDGHIEGDYQAHATKIKTWRTGDYNYTETKKFKIVRKGSITFKNFVENALKKNEALAMIESVQPFSVDKAQKFSSKYLAGFQADKRDLKYEDLQANIRNELQNYGKQLMKNSVQGYARIYSEEMHYLSFKDLHEYVLLPVWILTYKGKNGADGQYYYAMNGESGKISGKLPVDKKKLALSSAGIFSVIMILLLIGGYFI